MKPSYAGYIKHALIFTLVIGLLGYLLFYFLPGSYYTQVFPVLLLFFLSVSLTVHYLLIKAIRKRPAKFINQFMLTTFLKLMFYIVVMVVYALLNRDDAIPFIVTYFILYLFYTGFELISILRYNNYKSSE